MVITRRRCLFQKNEGRPAPKAVPDGQMLRLTSSSNQALVSSKLETTTAMSRDHTISGKNLVVGEKISSNDNQAAKSGVARVMRIKVVVTQRQLSQILKESRNSASLSSSSAAVKQMLLASAIKMSITENSSSSSDRSDQGGSRNGRWRPRLKSILEE